MNAVRQVVVWRKLSPDSARPPADYHSFAEHEAIVAALENRDRGGCETGDAGAFDLDPDGDDTRRITARQLR